MRKKTTLAQRVCWLIASAFVFSLALLHRVHVSTQEAPAPYLETAEWETQAPSWSGPRWFRRRGESLGLVTRIGKNHENVLDAFEDVVSDANKSTVRIFAGKQQVSLGLVVRQDGLILAKATELDDDIECRVPGNVIRKGSIVATDTDFDLALIKIDAEGLTPAKLEAGNAAQVGSWVATPSGFTSTPVAVGVVSVAPRRIRSEPAVLGIQLDDSRGAPRITEVMENSGAEKAGLEVDDVVVKIDGNDVPNFLTLRNMVRQRRPGEKLRVEVTRGEETVTKLVELTQQSEVLPDDEAIQNAIGGDLSRRRAGFPEAMQHDTVLAPHQCGGPLVDLDGNVIGVNIARAGRVATYAVAGSTLQPRIEALLQQADARN